LPYLLRKSISTARNTCGSSSMIIMAGFKSKISLRFHIQ
jgi:hypothetical protein